MALHLRYRLWIAEINSDITILRIFEDYIESLSAKEAEPEVKSGIDHFHDQFKKFRTEIDDLRHELHLLKMKLGAYARNKVSLDYKAYKSDKHITLRKNYQAFRSHFEKLKKEFSRFEEKWLG